MTAEPDTIDLERLYDEDFVAWSREQAAALRRLAATRRGVPGIDFPHLIEEVEDLGRAESRAVVSQLRRIIEHCLKLSCSPAEDPRRQWQLSIRAARREIRDRITPVLLHELRAALDRQYRIARDDTDYAMRLYDEHEAADRLPGACPWTLDQLLDADWFPDPQV
ncbi:MAG: DUF29 domain-containing protein [Geminicoccaceae bacterium]|nr:DUF29 domain-containing protein [Geminicoccaceae bacterium]